MIGVSFGVIWNVFLALIPVGLAYLITLTARRQPHDDRVVRGGVLVGLGLLWLLFLPNTCYLLTEWRHFLETVEAFEPYSQWRNNQDTVAGLRLLAMAVFYLCYSAFGMLAFALAIRPVARLLRHQEWLRNLLGIPFFALIALGVYLGLVHRFNSWDLFSLDTANAILDVIASLCARPALSAFILAFGGFLWLAFIAIDIWIDGLLLRLRTPAHGAETQDDFARSNSDTSGRKTFHRS